jgi:hypothetical protein
MAKDTMTAILEWYEVEADTKETLMRYIGIAEKEGLIGPQERRELEWFVKTRRAVEDCVC